MINKLMNKLNSEEFYNLMQDYRHLPLHKQKEVSEKFEEIKNWIIKNV